MTAGTRFRVFARAGWVGVGSTSADAPPPVHENASAEADPTHCRADLRSGRGAANHAMATLSIKVVPGSSRDRLVARYGDAIKVQVSAPPEGGKANQAVVELIAEALGVRPNQVRIAKGQAQSRKIVQIDGLTQTEVDARLAPILAD